MKEWWKKNRIHIAVGSLFVVLALPIYDEPTWLEQFGNYVINVWEGLGASWGTQSNQYSPVKPPPRSNLPPSGNQGPCPCGGR